MPGLDDVIARLTNDPAFADAVRTDPVEALRGYRLDASELARVEQLVGTAPSGGGVAAHAARGARRSWRTPAMLGALGVAAGAAGFVAAGAVSGDDTGRATLRPDAATFYDCSTDAQAGAPLGLLHRGDTVWVIGRSGERWLVVRNPGDLTTPAWMLAGDLEPDQDVAGLPVLDCDQAIATAATAPPVTVPPTEPPTVPPTEPPVETSTTVVDTVPATTVPPTSPPTVPPTTPPTTAPDTTPPVVQVSTDSSILYSQGGMACAGWQPQQLTVTVTATDANGATVLGVDWQAGSLSGSGSPLGGNTFRIGPVFSIHSGTLTMTITGRAVDGRGNQGTGQTTVQFRQITEWCIG